MTWWRKLLSLPEPGDELYNGKKSEPEETLEEWRLDVENKRLKIRGSKLNESPYTEYFFKYCQYCYNFSPESACFEKDGTSYIENLLHCSKLRVNMKKLDERK